MGKPVGQVAQMLAGAPLSWAGFALGLVLIGLTWKSVVNTIILPRTVSSRVTFRTWALVNGLFLFAAKRLPSYKAKDALLAYLSPVTLLANLFAWLALFFGGFALVFWPLSGDDFGRALQLSGSSIFTLGIATSAHPGPLAVEFLAAASGLVIIALQIGYLPTIYSAYNRREMLVTLLSSRAGRPSWGPEILARYHLNQAVETLPALYSAWESWSADITESHTSYPWLLQFRGPDLLESWVVSLLSVLDAAALSLALCPSATPGAARQCLRMGYVSMRTLAHAINAPVDDDPRPDQPTQLTFEQYALGVRHLRDVGFPLERTAEEAWHDFRGWRVNYEAAAYALAQFTVAPPAPWSGPRTYATKEVIFDILANRPRHRTPTDPDGLAALPNIQAGAYGDERSWRTE
jgi:hypothetical protein